MEILAMENLAVSVTFWSALAAMAAFILQLGLKQQAWPKLVGQLAMGVALVGSLVTLVLRAQIAQHAPWSNLWESMITVLFGSLVFYFIVELWYKPKNFGLVAAPLVVLLIGGASILPPGFKGAAPLMPALQSYWIKVHVLIMLFSYAAFTMSFAAAVAYFFLAWKSGQATPKGEAELVGAEQPKVEVDKQLAFFDELTYRLILMGFPLLMIGIITGAMWANGAWGTYWSWDPKETWALITWFIYAAYLHARISRDWTGHKAQGLAGLGFCSMAVTYIGVNYLSHGLHSYGFLR